MSFLKKKIHKGLSGIFDQFTADWDGISILQNKYRSLEVYSVFQIYYNSPVA